MPWTWEPSAQVAEPERGLERVENQCPSRIEERGHDTSTETRQFENILRDASEDSVGWDRTRRYGFCNNATTGRPAAR